MFASTTCKRLWGLERYFEKGVPGSRHDFYDGGEYLGVAKKMVGLLATFPVAAGEDPPRGDSHK